MKDISLNQVLEEFFNFKMGTVYTSIPCRVVTVKSSLTDQRVDVQPLPNRILPDGNSKELPTILNVPVMFPASKKASLTFPIDIGDTVLCVFSQRSLDAFKASSSNKTYVPQNRRKFDIRDAIAIPGLFPFSLSPNNPSKHKWAHSTRDLVIVNNIGLSTECEIRLKENGNIEMYTDQDFFAQFNNGIIECNNMTINCASNFTIDAGGTVSISSGSDTTIDSGANVNITAVGDLSIEAATWTVSVSGTTTVNCPTTTWTGIFNVTGAVGIAGPLSMTGGGGDTATINAPLQVNNTITVTGGDVKADGVGLKSHVHSNPEGGFVGPATG